MSDAVVIAGLVAVLIVPVYFMIRAYRGPKRKSVSVPLVVSLSTCFLGFFSIIFGIQDQDRREGWIMLGVVLMLWGALLSLVPLFVFLFRRPTTEELQTQRSENRRTWHVRPLGLLIIIGIGCVFGLLLDWAQQQMQVFNLRIARRTLGIAFALVFFGICSLRPIRSMMFYVDAVPERDNGVIE